MTTIFDRAPLNRLEVARILRTTAQNLSQVLSRDEWERNIAAEGWTLAVAARRACGAWAWALRQQGYDGRAFVYGRGRGSVVGKAGTRWMRMRPEWRLSNFARWAAKLPNAKGRLPESPADLYPWAMRTAAEWLEENGLGAIADTRDGRAAIHSVELRNKNRPEVSHGAGDTDKIKPDPAALAVEPKPAENERQKPLPLPASHYETKFGIPTKRIEAARRDGRLKNSEKRGGKWYYDDAEIRRLWPEDFAEN